MIEGDHQSVKFNLSSEHIKVKTLYIASEPCFVVASASQVYYNSPAKTIELRSGSNAYISDGVNGTAFVTGVFSLNEGAVIELYASSVNVGSGLFNAIECSILKFKV